MFDSSLWIAFNEELNEASELMKSVATEYNLSLANIANEIILAVNRGNTLFFMGNGGSACDANHLQCELVHKFQRDRRKAIRCICFTDSQPIITAISNDWEYSMIFERQVEAWVLPKDVVVGVTTSGKSSNVIKGLVKARELGAVTIAFVGEDDGLMKGLVDHCFSVPSNITARVQEVHLAVGHILCGLIERFAKL